MARLPAFLSLEPALAHGLRPCLKVSLNQLVRLSGKPRRLG
jgi:hypothetical protein